MMTVERFEENLKQNNEKCDVLIQEILSTAGKIFAELEKVTVAEAHIGQEMEVKLVKEPTHETIQFPYAEVSDGEMYDIGTLKLHELLYRYLLHKFMLFDLLEELPEQDRKNKSVEGTAFMNISGIITDRTSSVDQSGIIVDRTVSETYFEPEKKDSREKRTEDILELAQQSVETIAHLQKGGLKFKDHSGTCGSVSSAVTKKILFLIALQKVLGITFEKHEAADIETVSDLTGHVKAHLLAKWQAGVPDAGADMEKTVDNSETAGRKVVTDFEMWRDNANNNLPNVERKACNVETCEKKIIYPQKSSELALRQNRLVDEINHLGDSLEQYSYLVYRSGQMPTLPEQYKTEANRVKGCQSVVWMVLSVEDGIMHFQADSDTLLMKGVIAVLQDLVDGVAAEDVCQTPIDIFDRTQLAVSFQSDRLAGIQSILDNIQKTACGAVVH